MKFFKKLICISILAILLGCTPGFAASTSETFFSRNSKENRALGDKIFKLRSSISIYISKDVALDSREVTWYYSSIGRLNRMQCKLLGTLSLLYLTPNVRPDRRIDYAREFTAFNGRIAKEADDQLAGLRKISRSFGVNAATEEEKFRFIAGLLETYQGVKTYLAGFSGKSAEFWAGSKLDIAGTAEMLLIPAVASYPNLEPAAEQLKSSRNILSSYLDGPGLPRFELERYLREINNIDEALASLENLKQLYLLKDMLGSPFNLGSHLISSKSHPGVLNSAIDSLKKYSDPEKTGIDPVLNAGNVRDKNIFLYNMKNLSEVYCGVNGIIVRFQDDFLTACRMSSKAGK
ncbi:MAG: hypothetical protein PHW04_08725 [Candidatus Wallbacteria bacterium]|nr:hypothetical protein [Candidatus Wallbacteria bacterium]